MRIEKNRSFCNCKGSFTVEAAYIIPLVLFVFCVAIEMAITLQIETKEQIRMWGEVKEIALIDFMYRKEYIEELLEELYED